MRSIAGPRGRSERKPEVAQNSRVTLVGEHHAVIDTRVQEPEQESGPCRGVPAARRVTVHVNPPRVDESERAEIDRHDERKLAEWITQLGRAVERSVTRPALLVLHPECLAATQECRVEVRKISPQFFSAGPQSQHRL